MHQIRLDHLGFGRVRAIRGYASLPWLPGRHRAPSVPHAFLLLLMAVSIPIFSVAQASSPNVFSKAAVVCAHPEAARVGKDVLLRGGNAADVAFAVHFALAVVYPSAGNLGGGGFVLWRSAGGEYDFLDFREKAPRSANATLFLDAGGNPVPLKSTETHAASGVPGSVAGLFAFHRKYGTLNRADLLEYAIRLAEQGFPITQMQAGEFNLYAEKFKSLNPKNKYLQKATEWKAGDSLVQKDLAKVLKAIQAKEEKGFYEGRTARLIVKEMKRGNGLITHSDLKNYQAVWRKPISGTYKGYKVVSAPPPSAGGLALLQMLKLSERVDFSAFGHKSVDDIFYSTEIQRLVYADRAKFAGDPDFFSLPIDSLLSDEYLNQRAAKINPYIPNKSSDILPGHFSVSVKENTTHFSIFDEQGNAVSLTTTINDHYGSKIFVTGAGFLLNNEMDDFSIKPGTANMYGLTGMDANAIAPGKRMLSSMTPTMVEKDGKLFLILGTPGGSTIITTVYRLIIQVIDQKMTMNEAVAVKRFHHQWLPDVIFYEEGALTPGMREELKRMGYELRLRGYIGRADCIRILPDGSIEAAPDPRGDDTAAGY